MPKGLGAPTVSQEIVKPRKVRVKCIAATVDENGNVNNKIYWGKDINRPDCYKEDKPFLKNRIDPYWTRMVYAMFRKW